MDYNPVDIDLRKLLSQKELKQLENVILHGLRGKLSQTQISKKLGHSFNIYGKWENGKKILMWQDLVDIASFRNIPIDIFLADGFKISSSSDSPSALNIINHFFENYFNHNYQGLAKYLGISQMKIRRLVKSEAQAPATLILKLLAYRPQHFLVLLEKLKVSDQVEEIKRELNRIKSLSDILAASPIYTAVLYFIETTEYQKLKTHSTDLIARRLSLTTKQVDNAIEALLKNNSIVWQGKKYIHTNTSHEFSSTDFRATVPLFNYWLYRLAGNLNNKLVTNNAKSELPTAYSYRVMAVSKKTAEQINTKIRNLYHEIIQLEKESGPEDVVVRVVMLNHFGLEDSPGFPVESDPDRGLIVKIDTPGRRIP